MSHEQCIGAGLKKKKGWNTFFINMTFVHILSEIYNFLITKILRDYPSKKQKEKDSSWLESPYLIYNFLKSKIAAAYSLWGCEYFSYVWLRKKT